MKKGAFPDFEIERLVDTGYILTDKENIKPSSIDLTLGEERYVLPAVMSLPEGMPVSELISRNKLKKKRPEAVIPVGEVVLVKLQETLSLRSDMYAYANPKSTTGRMDLHVRLLADGVSLYDTVKPKGYRGDLWVIINPNSFPVILPPGVHVNQLRFFNKDTRLKKFDLEDFVAKENPLYLPKEGRYMNFSEIGHSGDHSMLLSLDLREGEDYTGWVAKEGVETPVDFSAANGSYNQDDFFEKVRAENGHFDLEKGRFYILSSYEHFVVSGWHASEIAALDERFGDLRNHYAGFIDPGWGLNNIVNGKPIGKKITLEVRSWEKRRAHHRQPIARLKIEKMIAPAKTHYDTKGFSNYAIQEGPKLAKYFK